MAKPKTVHTLASLKARATEEGDCLMWDGYTANGVPMVHQNGRMVPVRKVMLQLTEVPLTGAYLAPKCGCHLCIDPAHIVQRSEQTHTRQMAKKAHTTHRATRRAAITAWRQANPVKLDMERAHAIRADERPSRQIAAEYGIDKSMVCRIRAGKAWKDTSNPFAGLLG